MPLSKKVEASKPQRCRISSALPGRGVHYSECINTHIWWALPGCQATYELRGPVLANKFSSHLSCLVSAYFGECGEVLIISQISLPCRPCDVPALDELKLVCVYDTSYGL